MKGHAFFYCFALAAAFLMTACGTGNTEPSDDAAGNTLCQFSPIGHYSYEHSFNYDLYGNHLDVQETGTMDFFADSTALDSARQVYTATLKDGGTVTYVFNYISPSRWYLDGDTFHFAGIKDCFRMDADREDELSQAIIKVVGGSIDYHYKFLLDSLTAQKMQWSFTYRDGHTDTWEFYRN